MKNIFKFFFFFLFILVLLASVGLRLLNPPSENRASVLDYSITEDDLQNLQKSAPEETPIPTQTPVPQPTPSPTPEPQPEYFTISFIGDLTLASHQKTNDYSEKMNGDYSYPFSKTVQYFESDDLTVGNLECTFSDQNLYSSSTFYFRSPSEWANILTEGGVDFVTTANNHSDDFGDTGKEDTYAALDQIGIAYGKEDQSQVIETKSGLKVGIYCAYNSYNPSKDKCLAAISSMQEEGAEFIIMAFHWGQELHYKPNQSQIDLAEACIDAGANVIYGCHPHVLAPLVEYKDNTILYSMGNFSFGGNTDPTDWDTAIVQITVKRDLDGTISTVDRKIIPCCCSSSTVSNNYCPMPYEEGTEEYERVLSKMDMDSDWVNATKDYSGWYASWK